MQEHSKHAETHHPTVQDGAAAVFQTAECSPGTPDKSHRDPSHPHHQNKNSAASLLPPASQHKLSHPAKSSAVTGTCGLISLWTTPPCSWVLNSPPHPPPCPPWYSVPSEMGPSSVQPGAPPAAGQVCTNASPPPLSSDSEGTLAHPVTLETGHDGWASPSRIRWAQPDEGKARPPATGTRAPSSPVRCEMSVGALNSAIEPGWEGPSLVPAPPPHLRAADSWGSGGRWGTGKLGILGAVPPAPPAHTYSSTPGPTTLP